jgi:hypothetical protein
MTDAAASPTPLDESFDRELARLNKERADALRMLRDFLDIVRRSTAAANREFKVTATEKSLVVARGAYEIGARVVGTEIEIVVSGGQQANEQDRLTATYRKRFSEIGAATDYLGQLMARMLLDRI